MLIIGCDFHARYQQIAMLDDTTGEVVERRRDYQRLKFRRGAAVAKVAIARKLAVRLYWKLREAAQPVPPARMQGSPACPLMNASSSRR